CCLSPSTGGSTRPSSRRGNAMDWPVILSVAQIIMQMAVLALVLGLLLRINELLDGLLAFHRLQAALLEILRLDRQERVDASGRRTGRGDERDGKASGGSHC